MATLYTQQTKNVEKTWFLMTVFFVVVVAIGWAFSYYYGNPDILYIFVAFSILMNIFSYWYSDKIVLKLAGAKEANKAENFDLYTVVENLSITAGFQCRKFILWTIQRQTLSRREEIKSMQWCVRRLVYSQF